MLVVVDEGRKWEVRKWEVGRIFRGTGRRRKGEERLTAASVTDEKAATTARNLVPKSMISSFAIGLAALK
jgi:hypothetical protein